MLTSEAVAPLRPRTITGDLEVQIHNPATGRFCRQAIGGTHTACGCEIDRRDARIHRLEQYDVLLCEAGCFTQYEVQRGIVAVEKQRQEDAEWTPTFERNK